MALIAELKRRKVIQVGVAYLVSAWLLMQVASIGLPAFQAPAWVLRSVIFLLALGFPLALVLAWVLDLTTEGLRFDSLGDGTRRVFITAAILAALAIGWFVRGGVSGDLGDAAFDAPLGPRSTAVLPFMNMSSDADNEHFSDGLTETLLHKLAQVTELKVAARTSSFAFKGKQQDIRGIGRELGVATVVEGSVQRAGDTLRITAQLVRTSDGSHIWSRNYDRKAQDIFAIQDEIAGAVTEALVGALAPEARVAIAKGGTQDLAAYDLYTRGLQHMAVASFDGLARAERLFQEALVRDPDYVDALVALAATWSRMARTGMFPLAELDERIGPILDRIEALDAGNGPLLAYRAEQARRRGDGAEARALFERALAAAPGEAEIHSSNGADLVRWTDDFSGALASFDRAVALDPLNPDYHTDRAISLLSQQRIAEAEQAVQRAIAIDPRAPNPYSWLGRIALVRGDVAGEAVAYRLANRADPLDHEIAAEIADILIDLGETSAVDAWILESRRLAPGNLFAEHAEAHLAFTRGDYAGTLAVALAAVARHPEERRNNWTFLIGLGCHAAVELGRVAELRQALERARMVPSRFTLEAMQSLVTPSLPLDHQVRHVVNLGPCLFPAGTAGYPVRAQLRVVAEAARGPGWGARRDGQFLAAMLSNEQAAVSEAFFLNDAPPADRDRGVRNLARLRALARFYGVADDPVAVARFAEAERAAAAQRARLPQLLAAAGVTLLPSPPAVK